ncbi:MAG TPA: hypothetical protein VGK74_25855 [Symbiobacteriaceae bacterium]|jgi:tetratricopeptide (TPR) repeat protein
MFYLENQGKMVYIDPTRTEREVFPKMAETIHLYDNVYFTVDELRTMVNSDATPNVVEAAWGLVNAGHHGEPAGTYALRGVKAALKLSSYDEAAVLATEGLTVAEPLTLIWADLQVNLAIACARISAYDTAIEAGERFIASVTELPEKALQWLPFAHRAVGYAYHQTNLPNRAVDHYRCAADTHPDPQERLILRCDLAYDLALAGRLDEAAQTLRAIPFDHLSPQGQFGFKATQAVISFKQGDTQTAYELVRHADDWMRDQARTMAMPLAELHFWMSHIYAARGNQQDATFYALHGTAHAKWAGQFGSKARVSPWFLNSPFGGRSNE